MSSFDWTKLVFLGMEWIWFLLGFGCLLLGLSLVFKPGFKKQLETLLGAWHPTLMLAFGIAFPLCIVSFKLAQFAAYQLLLDSGIMAHEVWNIAHGYGFISSPVGETSPLANHFALTEPFLLAPLLLLWNSAAALAIVQGAALGSSVLGIYLLARRNLESRIAALVIVLLAISQHFFRDLVGAALDDSVYALPLLLWTAFFWQSGRKKLAVLFGILLLTTRESVPFMSFGFGLYLLTRSKQRRIVPGACILISSVIVWLLEMKLIASAQKGWHEEHWHLFQSIGESREAVLHAAVHQPWKFVLALVYPPIKLWTPVKVFLSMALLPLAAGTALLPALAVWLPHQLADYGFYHLMRSHTGAFVFGPLILASIVGMGRMLRRLPASKHSLAFASILAVSGSLFLMNGDFLLKGGRFSPAWREAAPKALAHIPENAKVWSDMEFLPNLGLRRYIKALPPALPNIWFEPGLFMPDRVLYSLYWARAADPASVQRILQFLQRNGFKVISQEQDLVVLARSDKSDPAEPVQLVTIP